MTITRLDEVLEHPNRKQFIQILKHLELLPTEDRLDLIQAVKNLDFQDRITFDLVRQGYILREVGEKLHERFPKISPTAQGGGGAIDRLMRHCGRYIQID